MRKFTFTAWVMTVVIIAAFLLSGCTASVSALVEDLGSESEEKADKAVEALGKQGAEAVPLVAEALKDPSSKVRINAALALFEIEGEACAKSIVPLLDDRKDDVRAAAVRILRKTDATGVSEILAGAETYSSDSYIESATKVISAMGEKGVAWMLEAYDTLKQPSAKRLSADIIQTLGGNAYDDLLNAVKGKDIADPMKIAAAEIFCELGADGYGAIGSAYDKAAEPSDKQDIMELMLLVFGSATETDALNDMMARFREKEDFLTLLLDAYTNGGDTGKELIAKSVCKIAEQQGLWIMSGLITYYETQDAGAKAVVTELFSKAGAPAVKALVIGEGDAAYSLEILQSMDKPVVVESLTELLLSEDDFPKAVEYITNLGYPEFADGIASCPLDNVSPADADDLFSMLKIYATDPRIEAKIRSLCADDPTFRRYMAQSFSATDYEAGLDYKTKGDGDGTQDKIVILEYDYGEYYDYDSDDDVARYNLSVSPMSFELVPADKQLSLADAVAADTAVYIKTKLVTKGTYYFKSLGKKVKGCRVDYVISVVDLRTKTVLGSKTLKGHGLPNEIYDTDVLWSVKKYLGEPPDYDDVDAAILALLSQCTT